MYGLEQQGQQRDKPQSQGDPGLLVSAYLPLAMAVAEPPGSVNTAVVGAGLATPPAAASSTSSAHGGDLENGGSSGTGDGSGGTSSRSACAPYSFGAMHSYGYPAVASAGSTSVAPSW